MIVVPFDHAGVLVEIEAKMVAAGRVNIRAPVLVDVTVTLALTHYVAMNGGNVCTAA